MNPEQQKSILTIALYAAFADGTKHEREREEIRSIAESLGSRCRRARSCPALPGRAAQAGQPESGCRRAA